MDGHSEGRILEKLERMHGDIGKIERHLVQLNGSVSKHESRLCVIEDWRLAIEKWRVEHAREEKETDKQVTDLRIEIAKMAALGGSFGAVISIVIAALKVAGVM